MRRCGQRDRGHHLTGRHGRHRRSGSWWLWGTTEKLSASCTTSAFNRWCIIHPTYTVAINDRRRRRDDWLKSSIFCTTGSRGNRIGILFYFLLYFCLFQSLRRLFCRECLRSMFALICKMIVILFWLIGWIGTFPSGYRHRGPLHKHEFVT